MPDPFAELRISDTPVDPDPRFAAALRARIDSALARPRGVIVSDAALKPGSPGPTAAAPSPAALSAAAPSPAGIIPYLCVRGAADAVGWYSRNFGARLVGEPIVMTDGRIGHCELAFGDRVLYLSDESPLSHVAGPTPGADASVSLLLDVADVDAFVGRAAGAAAIIERPADDHPYGRNAVVRDPFGHRWMITGPVPERTEGGGGAGPGEPVDDPVRHGDVAYVSLWVPDVERASDFFADVLGWSYGPGSAPEGRQVQRSSPHHGLWGGQPRCNLFVCYFVDDVDDATRRVRDAGGQSEPPTREPYGRVANCEDDQGVRFAVVELSGGPAVPRAAENGSRHGDLAYVTMRVVDSTRARAFYGSVLGWRFSPGRVDDGWGVEGTWPMTGMHGGSDVDCVVPMYRVDDIDVAVARVRGHGGTSTDPETQPYGISAECTDDQGTRFYLGQL